MLKLNNQFKIIYIYLFFFLGLLFINNKTLLRKVIAMKNVENNQSKQIEIYHEADQPSEQEVYECIQIIKQILKLTHNIKQKNPHLANYSIEEIINWVGFFCQQEEEDIYKLISIAQKVLNFTQNIKQKRSHLTNYSTKEIASWFFFFLKQRDKINYSSFA
ncbi:SVM family protein [Candidatus Phytoplasma melaleucae]|uniref:SVM family protein n=1 Tax=Candidatus Phytoplasma melaleucae TaxID=2982630 RepID=A0ABT9DER2_9MOLU|nr:SVM family protein ['Melaleuca sp.' phytoplasma]MDO8168157.1 SVM family protein ['Melaleuca sp.' phytoplasma]MDV3205466.1 SVM family protein [Weeping tea tree witches'-broom phytoplasma]